MENQKIKLKDTMTVIIRSCFAGHLFFRNGKTGEETEWTHIGEEQELTIADIKTMRATQAFFFKNQWIRIVGGYDEDDNEIAAIDIINGLKLQQYYQHFIDPSDISSVCGWSAGEIAENVPLMNDSAKENLVVSLNDYIESGTLDSVSKIKAFEHALGCKLGVE